jgi:hypothetical protein
MKQIISLLLVFFTLFLVSCGNNSLLMSLSDSENAVTIRTTIDSGEILDPDLNESIGISFEYDESLVIPGKLEISFLDNLGLVIGEPKIIEGEALNEPLPSISLNSPSEAQYSVQFRVFDNDNVIIKEKTISFFYSRESLFIRALTPYPNVFAPGAQGLIFFDSDGAEDNWVRWSIDNEIIEEGFLHQYKEGFIWKAPPLEGVYGLRMELFPEEPLYTKNGTFPFTSPVRSDIEIFVTSVSESDPMDLYPPDSYSTILHFKGLVIDEGTVSSNISTVGSPVIRRQDDKLGFYLNKGSGYSIDENILPVAGDILLPFSITFSYSLNETQEDSYFLNIFGNNGNLFSIKTDSSGILHSEIFQTGPNILDVSGIYPELYNEITLSVIPHESTIDFLWYADGMLISSSSHEYILNVSDTNYKSIIAGGNGFEGLLDEFGVYIKDDKDRNNIDDNIYQRSVDKKYNSDKIIAAYGFDGLFFENNNNPSLSVSSGSLKLDYKSSFKFLETDFNFSYLYIDIDFEQISNASEIEISFPDLNGENNIHINLDNFSWSEEQVKYLKIELNINDSVLSILSGGEIIAETNLEIHSPAIFKVVNNSENTITKLASLLVRREEKRIVENIQQKLDIKL